MTVIIPQAGGVPGISGPPNWFSVPPGSYHLDDVNWRGATKRTFGGGAGLNICMRALQAIDGGQQYVYLSFWAAYVDELSDGDDSVFLGLQAGGGTAMVIEMRAHDSGPPHTGPAPAAPPADLFDIMAWTQAIGSSTWTEITPSSNIPDWIDLNARVWAQDSADVAGDPNDRWAVQLRIPVQPAGTAITHDNGPGLGDTFKMWYLIRASVAGNPLIADSIGTVTELNLEDHEFPAPSSWEEFQLASGPASFGGVALEKADVVVQNVAHGEGTQIDNHASNTFVARPRNYRPAGNNIAAGGINATFRIANWGSVGGATDFTSGQWDYVPGNAMLTPVLSSLAIPTLAAGNNPPATDPIALIATMHLGAGKSTHQCVLVTLAGNNLVFLNDSVYRNMNYDSASRIEIDGEINDAGMDTIPEYVHLSVERVNMPQHVPPDTDEGLFLSGSMQRLINQGGPVASKLKVAMDRLAQGGDYGSAERLSAVLARLHEALAELEYNDVAQGRAALKSLIEILRRWLTMVKQDKAAATRLADLMDAAADWLEADGVAAVAKLAALVAQVNRWLSGLDESPMTRELLPQVVSALREWLATLREGKTFLDFFDRVARWIESGRPVDQLPGLLNALREMLGAISRGDNPAAAAFARATADWLRGKERLDFLVQVLTSVGLTESEMDLFFPSIRIHTYYETGERVTRPDGTERRVLKPQPSFGLYAYHEGSLEGWQTSLEGARRVGDHHYRVALSNDGKAKITVKVQAVEPDEKRMPEDPIVPIEDGEEPCGCLCQLLRLLGIGKKT